MNEYKEFVGKNLDEAIGQALAHFGVDRDRLEIEIVSGGSMGIFGLVGVRKAVVRARARASEGDLARLVTAVVETLVAAVADDVRIETTIEEDTVLVRLTMSGDPNVLVGRDGQTLAAVQYLANRIIARRWPTPVRVRLDLGEYRARQDDNLRKAALFLADKAKTLGRPQSTKSLSSYHRRLIHLALEDDPDIVTRSQGEGPTKRVLILPRHLDGALAEPDLADDLPDDLSNDLDDDE